MGDGMIGVALITLWYCALVVLFALFVTGGKLASMGVFAAGFAMCILGIVLAVVMSLTCKPVSEHLFLEC